MSENNLVINYGIGNGRHVDIEVSQEVADTLSGSIRKIRSQRRQDRRKLTHEGYRDGFTELLGLRYSDEVGDAVERAEVAGQVRAAIAQLTKMQQRRIHLYYYADLTYQQIADIEGVSVMAVCYSMKRAEKKIKNCLLGDLKFSPPSPKG